MDEEKSFASGEIEQSPPEKSGLLGSIARVGSYLLDKVQVLIESQESEIEDFNRRLQHEQQNDQITRIPK